MNSEEKLMEIAAGILDVGIDELSLDSRREDIDSFDSLSIVQIISEMCEEFDVVIPDEKINAVRIDKISDFLLLLND